MDRYEKLKDKNSINQNIKIKHEIVKYDKNKYTFFAIFYKIYFKKYRYIIKLQI